MINQINVKYSKIYADAELPIYKTSGASAMDVFVWMPEGLDEIISDAGFLKLETGIAFEIPPQYGMFVLSRSGQANNDNARLANCVGLLDYDYRGQLMVMLRRDDGQTLHVKRGDRIAQITVVPTPRINLIEADALTETERGAGGLGSTGK